MSYIDTINNAPAKPAPKSAGTKDAIYGRLLMAMTVIHALESQLQKQSTAPAPTVVEKSTDRLKFEAAARRAKAKRTRPLSPEELELFRRGELPAYTGPRNSAPTELSERRERMEAAKLLAMTTGQSVKAF